MSQFEELGADEVYELGADEILELGLDPELVGRKARRKSQRRKADRRYVLGLGAVVLGAAGPASLTSQPSLDFRPDRLTLVDSVANNSLVTSIQAGNVNMLLGGSVPAAVFSALAVGNQFVGQTIGRSVQIQVNATLAAAGTISGAFMGLADQ